MPACPCTGARGANCSLGIHRGGTAGAQVLHRCSQHRGRPVAPGSSARSAPSARSTGKGTGATLVVARLESCTIPATGRDKPVPYGRPPWLHARIRHGTGQARPLRSPALASCTNSTRDGTSPSPTVARLGFMHEFDTGRDKPVPDSTVWLGWVHRGSRKCCTGSGKRPGRPSQSKAPVSDTRLTMLGMRSTVSRGGQATCQRWLASA